MEPTLDSETFVPTHGLEVGLQRLALLPKRTEAKFDSFYTPQNELFYSNSPYLPLNPARREIRLIRAYEPATYFEHIKAHPHWALDPPTIAATALPAKQKTGSPVCDISGLIDPHEQLLACEFDINTPLSKGWIVLHPIILCRKSKQDENHAS